MPNALLPSSILPLAQAETPRRSFSAVTLFLDISGFTPLTEALMQQGKVGAEVLAEIVNDTFHPVITAIYAYGGYIAGFAGDAFTAIFEDAAHAAPVSAALTIRQLFENRVVQTPAGEFPLAVKMGLAFGEVECGVVGEGTRRTYYFRGRAIDACAQAEHHCEKGDIVLTTDLARLTSTAGAPLGESFIKLTRAPATVPPTPSANFPVLDVNIAAQFYPRPILEASVSGEFRQLATVFVSFRNFSLPELNEFARYVLQEVDTRAGYFNRLDFGDKGGNCLLFFGAPVAHENDLARALQVAVALRDRYGDHVRCGVTFGQMYFGRVGIPERCEFTALGNSVNFAARLMMKADWGQLLAPETVAQHTGYIFKALGEYPYKGFAAPVLTFQIERATSASENLFLAPMVGRAADLQTLLAQAETALRGQAAAVFIYGEAGIGKSRLTFALREALGERVLWLNGQTDSILRQAFNPFEYLLRRYFQQNPETSATENRLRFDARLQELLSAPLSSELQSELRRTHSFLGALLNLHWPNSLYEQLTDGKLRYENTLSALRTFLLAVSRVHPIVIEIEDAHWLDEASREVLLRLTRQIRSAHSTALAEFLPKATVQQLRSHPLLLLFTSRYADDGSKPVFELDERFPITTLELHHLPAEALRGLAEHQLGGPLHESLFAFLEARSQAVPFFAQQLVLYLQELGALEQHADQWRLRSAETSDIPASLNAMLVARLDRLSGQVKQAVQTAAVLGREFDVRLLLHMLRSSHALEVQDAERGQIWSALTEIRYLFKHALLRDAAYDMQLRSRLRELHQLALDAYEALYAVDLMPYYDELAYHADQSGNTEKQSEYFRKAGAAAHADYRNAVALNYYARLLPLLSDPAEQIAYHFKRSAVLELIGQWDEAEATYRTALESAEHAADERALARCQYALGNLSRQRGDYAVALEWLERALASWRLLGEQTEVSRTLVAAGSVAWRQGNFTPAQQALTEGLALARAAHDQATEALALTGLGIAATDLGDFGQAKALYEQSLALRRELGDKEGIAFVLNNLGVVANGQGDHHAAQTLYEESLALRREIGDKQGIAYGLNNLGYEAMDQQDYASAQTMYEQCLTLCRELGDKMGIAMSLVNLGHAAYSQQNFASAREFYIEGLAGAHEIGDKMNVTYSLIGLAGVAASERRAQAYAAQLSGIAEAVRASIGLTLEPIEQGIYDQALALTRGALDREVFERATAFGQQLSSEEAVAWVLNDPMRGT